MTKTQPASSLSFTLSLLGRFELTRPRSAVSFPNKKLAGFSLSGLHGTSASNTSKNPQACCGDCTSTCGDNVKRQGFNEAERGLVSQTVRAIEAQATDDLFRNDIGIRGVNAVWLARMRAKISGRDVWMSGQQLVDEGSGNLIPAPAR
jgi:hypothetical protein